MEEGTDKAVLLMLDVPPSALCGIDLLSFTTSPRFHGIKHLPPGLHFVFTAINNSSSVRHGVWLRVERPSSQPAEVLIKKWDAEKEELVDEKDEAEQLRWRANLGAIWREGLSPYRQTVGQRDDDEPVEETNDWQALTDCITPTLLTRITRGDWSHWALSSASSAKEDLEEIAGLPSNAAGEEPGHELHFLPVDLRRTWREGAIGRERTEGAQDRSWALGFIIDRHCSFRLENEIIGELQMTFLMVLTLGNYSCLEQWRRIVSLLFTSRSATKTRPDLFVRFLKALKVQLQHCDDVDGGLFDLTDEGGVMLKRLIRSFRRWVEEYDEDDVGTVLDALSELEEFLKSEYGWDLTGSYLRRGMLELEDGEQVEVEIDEYDYDDETGEYAPVVVDLPEDYASLRIDDS
ncbi:AAR2-domain-containing protein [Xylona heveae TC161]|uniref:AAR2-domain-containing protein n=1 Tax=Xylona heveae (strain CBS 132557 / TC161) TaxID=1328760 RepID=A0A165GY73_XYLHT|nr:AAR2-domain-containing protein [Xylona heveae TC161]KZF22751.1 AAR2-domain-containing protein [Xylona heveae TC161]